MVLPNMNQFSMDIWSAIVEEAQTVSAQLEGLRPLAVMGGELMPDLPGKDIVPGLLRLTENAGGTCSLFILSNDPDERIRAIRLASRLGAAAFMLVEQVSPLPGYPAAHHAAILTDQANFSGVNPLIGPNDERFGPRFPDMSKPFDDDLIRMVGEEATRRGITLRRSVLAGLSSHRHEDASVTRHLQRAGADCVHHRIAQEVIVARHVGLRTMVLVSEADNQAHQRELHALAIHALKTLF